MELILHKGLIAVGHELLGKVGQRLVGPVGQRIGRILMAIGVRPLIPHTGAEDAEPRNLAELRGLAILAVAVVLVHTAGERSNTLLRDRRITGRHGQA